MKRNLFNEKEALHFNDLHQIKGLSLRQIAKYGTSHGVIKRYLVNAGYSYRQRNYMLNEVYFKKLDS